MIRIFYVEDEPFLAKIVKETLESRSYEVTLIDDGDKAMQVYAPDKFDICILDIMLPNKNGYDIAKAIRSQFAEVPIIFLTAKDQVEDILKGFDAGGNDYLKKPFSMEELLARIENLLKITKAKHSNARKANIIPIGKDYTFAAQKLELKFKENKRTLSHRESQILELLCQHKDETTPRKEILMKIWGDDSFYNSRNLDVYITKLRGYFKQDAKIKIITLKGVGYQFMVED